tara:strand:- start:471 stop:668 length:198 start_codon:yes stop_codon:yes gene_type:complete
MLVFRCIGSNNFFLEKVIFPFEDFYLMAPHGAKIEIWGNSIDGQHIEERIRLPVFGYDVKEPLAA